MAAVSDEMVDAIDVVGDEALVADTVTAYRQAGVDVPIIFPLTWGPSGTGGLDATLQAAASTPPT